MKRKLTILFLLLVAIAATQTTHTATLTWTDNQNPSGTTYNVYRAQGLCSGSPVLAKIATAVGTKTYQDTTVTPGNYCYAVTAVVAGAEGPQSPTAAGAVLPFAPTGLSVTIQ